jgi:hypothetical protein
MPHIPGHVGANTFQDWTPQWWGRVLEEFEPAQYYSSPSGVGFGAQSPRRQRYFQDAYQDVLKDYYGSAGTAMRQGQTPMSFMDFLETDPWTARYSRLPQTARGTTGMMSSPRTRFLYNY